MRTTELEAQRHKALIVGTGGAHPDGFIAHALTFPEVLEQYMDQRFIGDEYTVASAESTAAIREPARAEGVFVGPVYTGKELAGSLDHARGGDQLRRVGLSNERCKQGGWGYWRAAESRPSKVMSKAFS
ncbi:hypothetical protein AB0C85_38680, partial [Streptomyces antimycoticus]